MSFSYKSTVIYRVFVLDVWGDDGDWTVNDRREAGSVSVRTDRQNKAGQWDISNKALTRALIDGHYLADPGMGYANYSFSLSWTRRASKLSIDGEDDGVLFVDDARDGYPLLQLEYDRHHDVEEKPKGLFGEPSRENPVSDSSDSISGTTIALVAGGVVAFGLVGYLIYKNNQSSQVAANQLPVVQTPISPGPTPQEQSDATDQIPPFVPGDYGSGGGPGGTVPSA